MLNNKHTFLVTDSTENYLLAVSNLSGCNQKQGNDLELSVSLFTCSCHSFWKHHKINLFQSAFNNL